MAEAGYIDHDQGSPFTLLATNLFLTSFQFERIDPEAHEQLKSEKEQLEVDVTTLRAQLTRAETQVRRHESHCMVSYSRSGREMEGRSTTVEGGCQQSDQRIQRTTWSIGSGKRRRHIAK
jgi:hypothetical protein